jgi:hypothetical protein
MAAQGKKGKNSQKAKSGKSSPAKGKEKTSAPAQAPTQAENLAANGAEAALPMSDKAPAIAGPMETSTVAVSLDAGTAQSAAATLASSPQTVNEVQTDLAPGSEVTSETQEQAAVPLGETPSAADPQTIVADSSPTLTEEKDAEPAASPTKGDYVSAPEFRSENFQKSEIKTLLVPVSPFHRLIAFCIVLVCYATLGYIALNGPPSVNAHGMHVVDLPEPGAYVLIFKGDLQDPFGWTVDGRFRNSLEILMEPIEPDQRVEKIEPIKDLSGADFFSVAEFEVNQPGKYNLFIKWNDPKNRCKGKITLEKDPVEKFFFKWVMGIIGTIALFFMCGIPMTTQKAQSTLLPAQKPSA